MYSYSTIHLLEIMRLSGFSLQVPSIISILLGLHHLTISLASCLMRNRRSIASSGLHHSPSPLNFAHTVSAGGLKGKQVVLTCFGSHGDCVKSRLLGGRWAPSAATASPVQRCQKAVVTATFQKCSSLKSWLAVENRWL
jgi:hypothetical protein